ncbi:thiamine pyrophosphate-binding protein [Cellulosimicrobium funkei]|nr:thiamine pyrophosphate-binding protein [Cellulosimicrobium funkei]
MSRTNADLVLDALTAAGVDLVFTCPGTTEVPLLDASIQRQHPRFVLTTHETTTVAAADAYSRATGQIGVALLHANVGLTNGLAMVEAARVGRSRLLILNGTKPLSIRNRRGFTQTAESETVARYFTVQATSVATHASLPDDVAQAIQRLNHAPYGPVYLELPQDVMAEPTDRRAEGVTLVPATVSSTEAVHDAAAVLTRSERVVVVVGSDLAGDGSTKIVALAEELGAPLLESPWRELERETVDTNHPHYAGVLSYSAAVLKDATVLVAGTPAFQEPDAGPNLLSESAAVIHLLTHPEGLIPGSLPVVGDVHAALSQLTVAVGADNKKQRTRFRDEVTARYRQQFALQSTPDPEGLLSVNEVVQELDARSLSGPIVVDAVTASAAVFRFMSRGPCRELYATGSGALGWGVGAAVGVALSKPRARVYAIVSDGVLQFGVQALHTAVAERLAITYVVVNNETYHAVVLALKSFGAVAADTETYPCTGLGTTNWAAIAQGFGLSAERVTTLDELRSALASQEDQGGPALVEVMVSTAGAGNTAR